VEAGQSDCAAPFGRGRSGTLDTGGFADGALIDSVPRIGLRCRSRRRTLIVRRHNTSSRHISWRCLRGPPQGAPKNGDFGRLRLPRSRWETAAVLGDCEAGISPNLAARRASPRSWSSARDSGPGRWRPPGGALDSRRPTDSRDFFLPASGGPDSVSRPPFTEPQKPRFSILLDLGKGWRSWDLGTTFHVIG